MTAGGRILLWSSNIWIFADGLLGPLFAVFAQKVGGDVLEITWAWAIYLIATGIASMVVGKISDVYIKKETLLTAGYALTALFTFGYLFVSTPVHLFVVQAGLGLALALCNAPWFALYDEYSDDDQNGYIWGLTDGLGKIIGGTAIIVGGFIVSVFSFNALFITMGILQTAALLYQLRLHTLKRPIL